MTSREAKYHSWHQFVTRHQCPEFPWFGARYPDACCIDGWLWDLDKYDSDAGGLYGGGEELCPFCHPREFIQDRIGDEWTRKQAEQWLTNMRKKYGYLNTVLPIRLKIVNP